jgi:hypothetical protein
MVPALGIEPSSTALQTAAMTTSAKLALAGPTGIEPITSRSKREMISISPRTELFGVPRGTRTPTNGFGDRNTAIILGIHFGAHGWI